MAYKKIIFLIFILALILRIASALFLDHYFDTEKEFLDERTYNKGGTQLAVHWETGDDFDFEQSYPSWRKGYFLYVAALYRVFGYHQLVARLANALLGAVFVFILYGLGCLCADKKTAAVAAFIYAVWPSCIFWASLNLKQMWIVTFTALSLMGFFRCLEKLNVLNALLCVFPVYVLFYFQDYSALLLIFVYFTVLVLVRPLFYKFTVKRALTFGGCFIVFLLLFGYVLKPHFQVVDFSDFTWLSRWRDGMTLDDSAFMKGADISTPFKIIRFLPVSMVFFFFAPFPPFVHNARLMAGFIENIFWYFLFVFGVVYIGKKFGEGKNRAVLNTLIICFYIVLLSCGFSLLEGNIGSMFRHRFQILPFYFIFSAGWIATLIRRDKDEG